MALGGTLPGPRGLGTAPVRGSGGGESVLVMENREDFPPLAPSRTPQSVWVVFFFPSSVEFSL